MSRIKKLPTTVAEVHANIHYSQIGHNENGIDAAYNMYHIVKGTNLFNSSAKVKDRNGKILKNKPNVTVQFLDSTGLKMNTSNPLKGFEGEEIVLSLKIHPTYMAKKVHIRISSGKITYDAPHQVIKSTSAANGAFYVLSPSDSKLASLSLTLSGMISPQIESTACHNNRVTISWKNIIKTIGGKYRIYRTTDLNNWGKPINTVTLDSKSYSDTTLQYSDYTVTNGEYYYAVESFNSNIAGGITSYAKVTYSDAPKLKSICGNSSGITVKWEGAENAVLYRVYRKNQNGGWSKIGNTSKQSFTDKNVTPDVTYTYTVRCMTEDHTAFTSGYDSSGLSLKYAATPSIKYFKVYSDIITIVWRPSKGAEIYRVFRKTKDSDWKRVGETTNTSIKDMNVRSGVTYYYTVRCMDSKKKTYTSGFKSNGVRIIF